MTRRASVRQVAVTLFLGAFAGILFQSCTQEQRLAGAREQNTWGPLGSAATLPSQVHEWVGVNSTFTGNSGATIRGIENSTSLLEPSTLRCIRVYGPAIKRYSLQYDVDWRLVLAIMKQESRYRHEAESRKGAAGLMQLMPVTSIELTRTLELDDLSHPEHNIQAGIYYLRKLYDLFAGAEESDRWKLTLAAYNAGFSRVHDAQDIAVHLLDRPLHWEAVRDALPLLSRQFYTLHRTVWGQDRPKSGWFGNARETIRYVESVMDTYGSFRLALR